LQSYARDLRLLAVFTEDAEIQCLTPDVLSSFFISDAARIGIKGLSRAPISVNRIKASVRSFCSYLVEAHNLDPNPARTIRIRRPGKKVVSALTTNERNILIEAVKTNCSQRDFAMLTLFVNTGIRLSELVNLDIGDLDMTNGRMTITAKGGNAETKFMNETTRNVLAAYLDYCKIKTSSHPAHPASPASSALFLSNRHTRISARQVQMRFGKWLELAGIDRPGITFIRFATRSARSVQTNERRYAGQAGNGAQQYRIDARLRHMSDEEVKTGWSISKKIEQTIFRSVYYIAINARICLRLKHCLYSY
jgi:site-specific recombinase XerC